MLRKWLLQISFKSFLKSKILWLFLVALLCHGLLLLMDGIYWDDYWLLNSIFSGKMADLSLLFNRLGSVFNFLYYFHLGIYAIFGKNLMFGYRISAFLLIYLSGVLIYILSRKFKYFNENDSFWVAAFAISYPAYETAFLGITLPGTFRLFVFLASCYLTLSLFEKGHKPIGERILCLTLFILSFTFNSILVFYFGFIILLFYWTRSSAEETPFKKAKNFIYKQADFVILPFLFWIVKIMFYPVHDQFEGYNQLIFGAPSWLYTMLSSSILALYYSLKPIFTLINEPLFVISLLLYLCYVIYFGIKEYYSGKSLSKEWPALLFGLLLFFLAIFPYLAVGKKPVDHYNSRYFILIGIPIGIIIVSLMNLSVRLSLLSKNIKYFVFLVLIGAFVLADLNDYLTWQFRWIKDRSVMIQLAADPQAKEISTFYIRNKLFHPDESPIYDYRLSEWTGMFKSIWHDEKHLGLDESALNTIAIANLARLGHLSARFMLSDYNAKGAKALLVLSYPEQNESYLALKRFRRVIGRYYYYKYFDKKKLNGFLRKLVEVKVVKL